MIRLAIICLSLAFAAPAAAKANAPEDPHADAAGAHDAHHHQHLNWFDFSHWLGDNPDTTPPVVALVINFLLLVAVIYIILRKPLSNRFRGRREQLDAEYGEARRLKEEAEAALAEARRQLEAIDKEMSTIKQDIIAAGQAESERIVGEAERRAERLRSDMAAIVEQEVALRIERIRGELVAEVMAEAEKLVRSELSPADVQRLTGEYIEQLGQSVGARDDSN